MTSALTSASLKLVVVTAAVRGSLSALPQETVILLASDDSESDRSLELVPRMSPALAVVARLTHFKAASRHESE
jgi:hypothetical protein